MTTAERIHEAKLALVDFKAAQTRLRQCLLAAFPPGTQVISHARKHPIHGKSTGVGGEHSLFNAGYVYVQNSKTGKYHQCYALSEYGHGLELAE